jgi:hypothetical protein
LDLPSGGLVVAALFNEPLPAKHTSFDSTQCSAYALRINPFAIIFGIERSQGIAEVVPLICRRPNSWYEHGVNTDVLDGRVERDGSVAIAGEPAVQESGVPFMVDVALSAGG